MTSYQDLIKKATNAHEGLLINLRVFKPIIECVNKLVEEAEKNPAFGSILCDYPKSSLDYLLITLFLVEKGSIAKDAGIFVDELQNQLNLRLIDSSTDGTQMTRTVIFKHSGIDYSTNNLRHPKIIVKIDASKSEVCRRVPTGEMIPVYELVCDDA